MNPRMHADEVEVDVTLVRRLLRDQAERWSALPLRRVGSAGTDHAVFRLGEELVVRLPRIGWAAEDIEKDWRWLPRVASAVPVAVPEPVLLGAPGHGYPWPWGAYRWVDGVHPVPDALGDGEAALAGDVSACVSALRGVEVRGPPMASRGGPLSDRDEATRAAIAELGDRVDADGVLAVWDRALAAPAWSGAPVPFHGDLKPDNLLVVDGRLGGVLDFGAFGAGDPAVDLIVAWNLFGEAGRAVLRGRLSVDEATWERGRGWALSIALIALPYYWDTNPSLVENAQRVLRELLSHR